MFGKITLDDAAVLRRPEPLLSPYIYLAYDYDNYRGWYFETGVSHDFPIEGTALTLTTVADIAYVHGNAFFALTPGGNDSGFQHYDLGLIARYTLNTLFNIPQRLGHWSLNGYLYYTNGLNENVRADTEVWGGAGIQFTY